MKGRILINKGIVSISTLGMKIGTVSISTPGMKTGFVAKFSAFPGHILDNKGNKIKIELGIKYYSTDTNNNNNSQYWSNIYYKKKNEANPYYLVDNFFERFTDNYSRIQNINYSLINKIHTLHLSQYKFSLEEFDILNKIKPLEFELHNTKTSVLSHELLGKYIQGGNIGTPGAYVFTNKINGHSYVGSSLSLITRLTDGYFRNPKGKRSIIRVMREIGLSYFKLEVYVLPSCLIESIQKNNGNIEKIKLRNLVLSLEQILILALNPQYNDLKVAGSRAGIDSVKGTFSYLYDDVKKELIFKAKTRRFMAEAMGVNKNKIRNYLVKSERFYLKRFFISDIKLNEDIYSTNIMDLQDLSAYIANIRSLHLKVARAVEIIDLNTNITYTYESLNQTIKSSDLNESSLRNYLVKLSQGQSLAPFKGRYQIKLVKSLDY